MEQNYRHDSKRQLGCQSRKVRGRGYRSAINMQGEDHLLGIEGCKRCGAGGDHKGRFFIAKQDWRTGPILIDGH